MKPDGMALPVTRSIASRLARRIRPRRPWMLVGSCLLLVVLTVTLWGKWVESRDRADRLSAELALELGDALLGGGALGP